MTRLRGKGGREWWEEYLSTHSYEKAGSYCSAHPRTRSVVWSMETQGQCVKCAEFDPEKVADYEKIAERAERAMRKLKREED